MHHADTHGMHACRLAPTRVDRRVNSCSMLTQALLMPAMLWSLPVGALRAAFRHPCALSLPLSLMRPPSPRGTPTCGKDGFRTTRVPAKMIW